MEREQDGYISASVSPTGTERGSAGTRRKPIQRRSRERQEKILGVASRLIVEHGSDALKMSEIATRAGISIGSLYQYFPDKTALIETLAEHHNALGRACALAELTPVQTPLELKQALERLIDGHYAMYLEMPVMRHLWAATQADRALQDLERADSAFHARTLQGVLERLYPRRAALECSATAILVMELVGCVVRLALPLEATQARAVLAAFKRMLPEHLLGTDGPVGTPS